MSSSMRSPLRTRSERAGVWPGILKLSGRPHTPPPTLSLCLSCLTTMSFFHHHVHHTRPVDS
jgi:hypothetical protein